MSLYPTEAELKKIEKWEYGDPIGLMDYIKNLWKYEDRFVLTGKRILKLYLSTAGWSGNKTIIEALRRNPFWLFYWQKSQRGGHHWFRIPLFKRGKK